MNEGNNIEAVLQNSTRLQKEVRKQTLGYILGGLSFVAGLAWNDAIKTAIEFIFPLSKDSMWVKFLYAVILTVIIVLVTMWLTRVLNPKEKEI